MPRVTVLQIEVQNAFNLVSRNAVSHKCATSLPWDAWCYDTHLLLWHPLSHRALEAEVWQGDQPTGTIVFFFLFFFCFAIVLHKITGG